MTLADRARRGGPRRALILALGSVLGSACGASAVDLAEVRQRGALRALAVIVEEEPEFLSLKPGGPPGFDHEVLDGFVRLHKLRLEVVPVTGWDELVPALLKGKGDLIAGRFTVTEPRRKRIDFTAEVFPTRNVVMTRKPRPVVGTVEALRAEKVGVVKGTSMTDMLAAAGVPPAHVDDQIPSGGTLAALKSGRITCTVDEVAGAIMSQRRDPDLQIGLFLGPPGSYAYGVRKDDAALLAALSEYVENLRRTTTWNRLVVKYFGASAPEILKKARTE